MWYYIIVLIYTIMIIAVMVSSTNSIEALKYMVGIIYVVLSLLLCIVLDELKEIKKRIRG